MAIKHIKIGSTTHDVNDARNVVIGDGVDNIVKLTLAQYNALTTKDPDAIYCITDAPSSSGSGDANVIETVKVNGTALTPDANKAVDVPVPIEHIVVTGVVDPMLPEDGELDGVYASVHSCYSAGRYPVLHTNPEGLGYYDIIWTFINGDPDDGWYDFQTVDIDGVRLITLRIDSSDSVFIETHSLSEVNISGKEDKTNKVTALSSSSTDTQYPSAKCVYDYIRKVIVPIQGPQSEDIDDISGSNFVFTGMFEKISSLVSGRFCPILRMELHQGEYLDFKFRGTSEDGYYRFTYNTIDTIREVEIYDNGGNGAADYNVYNIIRKGTTSGNGNAVTDISVSGNTITLTKGSTFLTSETSLSLGNTSGNGNAVTDISVSGHQITMTKGSTFLTSYTETDPVFTASAAHGISSTDITNWNAKQKAITVSSSEPTSGQGSNGDIWIVI